MAKKEDPNHVTTRPYPSIIFQNYDYGGSPEGDETSPGTGFFSNIDKVDSVGDFLDKKHKANHKIRQAEFESALGTLANIQRFGQEIEQTKEVTCSCKVTFQMPLEMDTDLFSFSVDESNIKVLSNSTDPNFDLSKIIPISFTPGDVIEDSSIATHKKKRKRF